MGLLATCPKCVVTYASGTPCPNCGPEGGSGGETAVQAREVMAEFARRKGRHQLAYAAYMCRMMAAGLAVSWERFRSCCSGSEAAVAGRV